MNTLGENKKAEEEAKKWANFYHRLRKQYNETKPFTYELDLISPEPKPRAAKFLIMVTKFINIYKWGLRETYDNEDDRKENYWTKLSKYFENDYEMGFVNEMYWEKPKNKIKKYFSLLIHTKRIFTVLEKVVFSLGELFQNPDDKQRNYEQEIKALDFLTDGQYRVMGELITSYQDYADKRREQEKIQELARLEAERRRKEADRLEQLRRQQQERERAEREEREKEELRKRQQVQQRMMEAKKKETEDTSQSLISSEYFPTDYKAAWAAKEKKIKKDPSAANLQLPNNMKNAQKIKNSERLFRERYKDELEVFSYNLKPEISQDKSTCFECKEELRKGVYILGGNQSFCYYTGQWYCNNCISEERMSIPWKALENFDLKGYSVCKKAHAELKNFYEKPIIQIDKQSPIIRDNVLHEFLVVRKRIHLIYDSICDVQLVESLLKKKENYCVKSYLFSMKNLYDIYNGQETTKIEREYIVLSKHFYRCEVCQKKVGYNCPTCKDPVKIFPFEIKEAVGCSFCRKMYHRKCLPSGVCKCREQD